MNLSVDNIFKILESEVNSSIPIFEIVEGNWKNNPIQTCCCGFQVVVVPKYRQKKLIELFVNCSLWGAEQFAVTYCRENDNPRFSITLNSPFYTGNRNHKNNTISFFTMYYMDTIIKVAQETNIDLIFKLENQKTLIDNCIHNLRLQNNIT